MLSKHLGLGITPEQRLTFVTLLSHAADLAALPADPEFRAALMGYAEWGTRLAVENSQPERRTGSRRLRCRAGAGAWHRRTSAAASLGGSDAAAALLSLRLAAASAGGRARARVRRRRAQRPSGRRRHDHARPLRRRRRPRRRSRRFPPPARASRWASPSSTRTCTPPTRPRRSRGSRCAQAIGTLQPEFFRLVIPWNLLQPAAEQPADLDKPETGCMREVGPCLGWVGVRQQLQALATRQRDGGWQTLVVLTGTPDWAASPPSGCEREKTTPRARAPRPDALPAYRQLILDVLKVAERGGRVAALLEPVERAEPAAVRVAPARGMRRGLAEPRAWRLHRARAHDDRRARRGARRTAAGDRRDRGPAEEHEAGHERRAVHRRASAGHRLRLARVLATRLHRRRRPGRAGRRPRSPPTAAPSRTRSGSPRPASAPRRRSTPPSPTRRPRAAATCTTGSCSGSTTRA